jgi:predicted patatin/cPLA2 family phospholipase
LFFEPVEINGRIYTDGGVRESSPIVDAIEAGATEIHLLGTGPDNVTGHFEPGSGFTLGLRVLGVMESEIERWDVKVVDLYNALYAAKHPKAVGKFHIHLKVLRPRSELLMNALDFNQESIRLNMALGYSDAKAFDWSLSSKVES